MKQDNILTVEHLEMQFGGIKALNDVEKSITLFFLLTSANRCVGSISILAICSAGLLTLKV